MTVSPGLGAAMMFALGALMVLNAGGLVVVLTWGRDDGQIACSRKEEEVSL